MNGGEKQRDGRPGPRDAHPADGERRDHEDRGRSGERRQEGRRSAPRPARIVPTPARATAGPPGGPLPRAAVSTRVYQIVQVMFQGVRTDYFTYRGDSELYPEEYVIVEADRGQDIGYIRRAVDATTHSCDVEGCDHSGHGPAIPPSRKVIRRAAPVDVERMLKIRQEEPELRSRTRQLVRKHGLTMKVSEAEWQWDRNKLTVYFTAEKRVDFRVLVKEMARTFRTRIELRQIGVRDEAKRLGGIGRCGRELCCRLWLPEIEPVTLQLAKDQGLSLNPAQISGACGRLMSCLHYEHELYAQARRRFPKVGKKLRTTRGEEEVASWNIFRETVSLRDGEGATRTVTLAELKEETARRRRNAGGGPGGTARSSPAE